MEIWNAEIIFPGNSSFQLFSQPLQQNNSANIINLMVISISASASSQAIYNLATTSVTLFHSGTIDLGHHLDSALTFGGGFLAVYPLTWIQANLTS